MYKTCCVKGCSNEPQKGLAYFGEHHMRGYNVHGLELRIKIQLCKACNDKLHKEYDT
jgi:hypothetical protein